MRTQLLLLPATLLVLALTACGGGGGGPRPAPTDADPEPTATSTPTSTETPEPTETVEPEPAPDPSTIPLSIHVEVNRIQIYAQDDTTMLDTSMYAAPASIVPELTEIFGFAPTITDYPGGLETAPSRHYDWSGFTLVDGEGLEIMRTDFVIRVTTASVAGIPVFSYHDLQIGDPMADAIAIAGETDVYGPTQFAALGAMALDPVSIGEDPMDGWDFKIYTAAYSDDGSGVIDEFISPTPNWGV